ncbi:hypothetical protein ACFFRR_006438 [Megaselia abdita]
MNFICGFSAVLANGDLGVAIEKFLNKLKKTLPCGFDQSLAPFVLADGDEKIHVVDYNTPDFILNLTLTKFKVAGGETYEVLDSIYKPDVRELELNLATPDLVVEVAYTMQTKLNSSYLSMDANTSGSYYLEIKQTNFHGKLIFGNTESGALMVDSFEVIESFSPQEGIYNYGPELQRQIDESFVEKDENINKAIEEFLIPKINEALAGFKTVEELTLNIEHGTGDDNTGLFGNKKC